MDEFATKLNEFLVETFNKILRMEEVTIRQNNIPLTVSELHLIDAVDKAANGENTIRQLAQALRITMSSVTIGVNKLIEKGYAIKEKSEDDKRSVHITLTKLGKTMAQHHNRFHIEMVDNISCELTDEEKKVLISALDKLSNFFKTPKK